MFMYLSRAILFDGAFTFDQKAWVDQSNANKNYNTIGLVIDANHPEKAKPVEVPINGMNIAAE